jgi:hypothetical protein
MPDEVACRVFPLTMVGNERDWFRELPPRSIATFGDLERMFLTQFIMGIMRKKPVGSLMSVRQGPQETLKDYLARFNL